jgi:hypothetical protein
VQTLLQAAQRPDVHEGNLVTSCYEAINVLISTVAPDSYDLVRQLVPELNKRLSMTIAASSSGVSSPLEKERQNNVQALLCGRWCDCSFKIHLCPILC